ncbi:MAG TPA: hypothetical protein VLJ41_13830, partial [Segetibacter sp.]|nr:hypothetical protein [Segetibacter sp.]
NAGVFSKAGSVADYYIVHSYFTPYNQNSTATVVLNSALSEPKGMMDYVKSNAIANASSVKPLALTEWNIFAIGSMQMVSHISGLHADLVLGELLTNKYGLASRWDLANGWENGNDHGMFNNGDETGVPKWNPRPVFYHMYYFQKMMGDRLVSSTVTGNSEISAYASTFNNTEVGVTIINRGATPQTTNLKFSNFTPGTKFYWYTLTGGNDNGEFSRKVYVNGRSNSLVSGGPSDSYTTLKAYAANTVNGVQLTVPARAAVFVVVEKK